MKIKTLGDAVKQVKNLFSVLGIDHWAVFLSESRYFYSVPCVPTYTENSKIEPTLGDNYKVHYCLTVSDSVDLFLLNENFLFTVLR